MSYYFNASTVQLWNSLNVCYHIHPLPIEWHSSFICIVILLNKHYQPPTFLFMVMNKNYSTSKVFSVISRALCMCIDWVIFDMIAIAIFHVSYNIFAPPYLFFSLFSFFYQVHGNACHPAVGGRRLSQTQSCAVWFYSALFFHYSRLFSPILRIPSFAAARECEMPVYSYRTIAQCFIIFSATFFFVCFLIFSRLFVFRIDAVHLCFMLRVTAWTI